MIVIDDDLWSAVGDPTRRRLLDQLLSDGDGTVLRLTESGFRERGWEIAQLEEAYHDHVSGWDFYLPRIADVAARQVAAP